MPVEVDQNATTVRSTDFTRITTKVAFAAKHFGLQLGQRTSWIFSTSLVAIAVVVQVRIARLG